MAEQPPPTHTAQVQAKNGAAAAGTAGDSAWLRGPEHPNPPEIGWREGPRYPNPPDPANPDPATLREQWLFATRRYSRWYSRAWGAAILAGAALFAVGWAVKGSNPLPSRHGNDPRLNAAGQKP